MIKRILLMAVAVAVIFAVSCGGRSDAELKSAAESALKGDPAMENVTVEVTDAVATLSGEVADDAARANASELARVEGMKSVLNNITVAAAPPPIESADDDVLKRKVEEALKARNCDDVSVAVSEGVVTLSGNVTREQFAVCIMSAQETKPKRVENKLDIKE